MWDAYWKCFELFGHKKCEYGPQNVEFACFLGRKWVCMGGVKNEGFSIFGGHGGDLYKDTYEAKLFGMHGGRFSLMWTSHGSQPFRR